MQNGRCQVFETSWKTARALFRPLIPLLEAPAGRQRSIRDTTGAAATCQAVFTNVTTTGTVSPQWATLPQSFADKSTNLKTVDRIAIGLGTRDNMTAAGGSGKMYFDDIRLYRPRTPWEQWFDRLTMPSLPATRIGGLVEAEWLSAKGTSGFASNRGLYRGI